MSGLSLEAKYLNEHNSGPTVWLILTGAAQRADNEADFGDDNEADFGDDNEAECGADNKVDVVACRLMRLNETVMT